MFWGHQFMSGCRLIRLGCSPVGCWLRSPVLITHCELSFLSFSMVWFPSALWNVSRPGICMSSHVTKRLAVSESSLGPLVAIEAVLAARKWIVKLETLETISKWVHMWPKAYPYWIAYVVDFLHFGFVTHTNYYFFYFFLRWLNLALKNLKTTLQTQHDGDAECAFILWILSDDASLYVPGPAPRPYPDEESDQQVVRGGAAGPLRLRGWQRWDWAALSMFEGQGSRSPTNSSQWYQCWGQASLIYTRTHGWSCHSFPLPLVPHSAPLHWNIPLQPNGRAVEGALWDIWQHGCYRGGGLRGCGAN